MTRDAPDAQIGVHRPDGERQPRCHGGSQNGVRRHGRGRNLGEAVDDVDEAGLEDQQEATPDEHAGHDLVRRVGVGRVAEPKHADGEHDGAEDHGRQSRFGRHLAVVLLELRHVEQDRVADVDEAGDDDAHTEEELQSQRCSSSSVFTPTLATH